jgi:hypothetical protein
VDVCVCSLRINTEHASIFLPWVGFGRALQKGYTLEVSGLQVTVTVT